MKKSFRFAVLLLFVMVSNGLFQTTLATDGYFGLGYGALNKGLAGAGTAWYKNSLINGNPAGNVFLGRQYNLGAGLFNPNREYTISGKPSGMQGTMGLTPGTVTSDSKLFAIPNLGANWMLNEKSSLSATLFGNGGMNTNYPAQTFYDQSSKTTGINLAQMFVGLTYSRKIAEKHSIGVTVLAAYQYFEAKGIASFGQMSGAPTKLSGNGTDNAYGVGFKIGYMGQLVDGLTLGVSYQPKTNMSKFKNYAGLFAEQGDFDIPSNLSVGLAYKIIENWAVMADFKKIYYSGVASVSNPMDPTAFATAPLGSDKGAGFGWNDISVYNFGSEYNFPKGWTFRAGYSHCDEPVPTTEALFNILAPGVVQDHITTGFSKEIGKSGKAIHVAFIYALQASVKGYNPMDFDAAKAALGQMVPNQTIEIKMNQYELEVAFTF
ncbi:MAG TPA: outer membrane protein transport protein [Prolixibacteraceae bacterium]|nr:outer membrane protein transport protein [Prolixibacteraceae bacterium]